MISCKVCHGWQPTQWDNISKYTDVSARCKVKNRFTTYNESCECASITPPKIMPRVAPVKTATVVKAITTPVEPIIRERQELYGHQKEAVERFKDAKEIALFWEMGVGKSRTVLEIVNHKYNKGAIDALLIIAPNDVHKQWAIEQVPMWVTVPYDCQCLYGRGGAKQSYPMDKDKLQIICVNIDTFSTPEKWREIVEWANYYRTMIVLDEATVIKNLNANRTQRILYEFNTIKRKGKAIVESIPKSVARAVLTGTPVTNGPLDLWCVMEFVSPNFFKRNYYSFQHHFGMYTTLSVGSRVINVPLSEEWWQGIKHITNYDEAYNLCGCSVDTFNTVHAQTHYEGPYKHADELKEALKTVSSFKKLVDCVDMPAQNYVIRQLDMTAEQRRCYDDMVDQYVTEYNDRIATALNKITVAMRLQQISSGFIYDRDYTGEDIDDYDIVPNAGYTWISGTNPKLEALYRDIDESDKPVIVITRFSAEAQRIYSELEKKWRCCLMTGWKRIGTIDDFKSGKYDVMVANGSVISRGLNLQNSHTILFYSNTFSLETRLQAEGRIFRLGQKAACTYIDYTYMDSIDEKIVSALRMKRNLLDYLRDVEVLELVSR